MFGFEGLFSTRGFCDIMKQNSKFSRSKAGNRSNQRACNDYAVAKVLGKV